LYPQPSTTTTIATTITTTIAANITANITATTTATTTATAENGRIPSRPRHGENDGDVEIYVGIIMQKIFLTFEFFCMTVQKISFGVQKKTIDLEFVVMQKAKISYMYDSYVDLTVLETHLNGPQEE